MLRTFKFSKEDLSEINKMDNHYKFDNTNSIISSTIIMEQFGGVESLAIGLRTNLETGISPNDLEDRKQFYGKNYFPPP